MANNQTPTLADEGRKRLQEADPAEPRADVIAEAAGCVLQNRAATYGAPEDNFTHIAIFWNAYLSVREQGPQKGKPLDAVDVAELMDLMKHGRRTINREHKDSWTDGIGYNACGWRCVQQQVAKLRQDKSGPVPKYVPNGGLVMSKDGRSPQMVDLGIYNG